MEHVHVVPRCMLRVVMVCGVGDCRYVYELMSFMSVVACGARRREHMVDLLCILGADVNARMYGSGATALHLASQRGHIGVVQVLHSYRALLNAQRWDDGATPLYAATLANNRMIVDFLCKNGAAVNLSRRVYAAPPPVNGSTAGGSGGGSSGSGGKKPFGGRGRHSVGDHSGAAGAAGPSSADGDGHKDEPPLGRRVLGYITPLWLACAEGRAAVVSTLLHHGAEWSCEVDGVSALDVAAARGHRPVVDMLVDFVLKVEEARANSGVGAPMPGAAAVVMPVPVLATGAAGADGVSVPHADAGDGSGVDGSVASSAVPERTLARM